ncbi:hypothetical protein BVX99_01300 [bacterium F16]|nr:hypothetical protein BVX99_01300 [bacterium F16]
MVKMRPLHKKNGLLLAEMTRCGYTIHSLSEAIGVHYLTVWRIVNQEHNPNKETASKIAERLGCTVQKLGLQVWGTGGQDK